MTQIPPSANATLTKQVQYNGVQQLDGSKNLGNVPYTRPDLEVEGNATIVQTED